MTSSLVGSEMCIRDRKAADKKEAAIKIVDKLDSLAQDEERVLQLIRDSTCLLYTSDAADDM
eukprot:4624803-Prorocentrum_lima.AAC.1